jgi:hypothetical protein
MGQPPRFAKKPGDQKNSKGATGASSSLDDAPLAGRPLDVQTFVDA